MATDSIILRTEMERMGVADKRLGQSALQFEIPLYQAMWQDCPSPEYALTEFIVYRMEEVSY